MKYRPDIDGLRTLAVVPVVVFHANIGMSGGFVGVDVFFVISGFLITSILLSEIGRGEFSLIRFYERRARRLFPALFTMMAVLTIAATIVMTHYDLREFAKSLIIPTRETQYPWAHSLIPIERIFHGCSVSLFQAWQQWSRISS